MTNKIFNELYAEYVRLTNAGSLKQANLKLVEIIGLMWERISGIDDGVDDLSDEDLELILTGDLDTDMEFHLTPKGDGQVTINIDDVVITPQAGTAMPEIDTDVLAAPETPEDIQPFDGAPVSEDQPEDATAVVAEFSTATNDGADATGPNEDTGMADEVSDGADAPKRRASARKKA